MHAVGSSWPSTAFCGNFSCYAKLVPKKGGNDNVPELQENRTEEKEIEKSAGTDQYGGQDDSEVHATGVQSLFSKHDEDEGFEEIDEACNALVKEAEDPEIKSDIKRLVELYKASKELTKTLEDSEKEKILGNTENDNIGNHDEIEETTANNFEQFKPLKDYYFSPEMANKNFEAIYKEYNEYLNKYYAFYPEYRKELDGLLSEDDIDIQNNCIRSRDCDSEASASQNDACEICALESRDSFDFQLPENETRIQTEVKPKPQTYPGYFYDKESNSYVYYYGPNQPYVDVRFGIKDEVNPEEENLAGASDECEDEGCDNGDDEEDMYYFPNIPELEENYITSEEKRIAEDDGLRIVEENDLHNTSNQIVQHSPDDKHWRDHNKTHQVDNDSEIEDKQSVSYYKYDRALGKYVLKVPKDQEEYEKFRQEYMKFYNLSDSNSNEQFEDMNAYEEYFRANFAEHVNDTETNKTDSHASASTRKIVTLNHSGKSVNMHYMSGSTLNIPTFEYKMLQSNEDGHNYFPKQETCPNGNPNIPRHENFYQSGQNCLQHQESYHNGQDANKQINWYQEILKDLSKQDEFEDKVNINLRDDFSKALLKPSPKVQTPKLNRFERMHEFLKSRISEDGDFLKPTLRLPKLKKPRVLSPIFLPSLLRNRRSAQPHVKGINDEANGEEWETFITVEGLVLFFKYISISIYKYENACFYFGFV